MKTKISIVIPRISQQAPCRFATQLFHELSKHENLDVSLFYLYKPRDDALLSDVVNQKGVARISIKTIRSLLESKVINSHCIQADFLVFFLKLFRKKIWWYPTLHCDPLLHFDEKLPNPIGRVVAASWLKVLSFASKVVFLNRFLKCKYQALKNAIVIYNGIDIDISSPPSALKALVDSFSQGRSIVGSYGVLRKVKGFSQLIDVAHILPESVCVIIAGDGPLKEEYSVRIAEEGLTTKVLLLGHIPNAHLLLKLLDVFVIPSHTEGFPFALLEAYAYGIRLVKSDIEQLNEVDDFSLVFKSGDAIDLRNKIISALEHHDVFAENVILYKNDFQMRACALNYMRLFTRDD